MKQRYKYFCSMIALTILFLAGCEPVEQAPQVTGTPPAEITAEAEWTGEPTLSSTAREKLQFSVPQKDETVAEIIVSGYGSILVRFFPEHAPLAVDNFLTHAREGYYDNTTFHRIINDFMIQGGDPEGTGKGGESIYGAAFQDEFSSDLRPFRGALCMANSGVDTNKSQFFLVQADAASVQELKELVEYKKQTFQDYLEAGYNTKLNEEQLAEYLTYGGTPWLDGHHTVFGQTYDGFEVLDAIAAAEVDSKNKPLEDILVTTVRVFQYEG